jgi:hypothetical protein
MSGHCVKRGLFLLLLHSLLYPAFTFALITGFGTTLNNNSVTVLVNSTLTAGLVPNTSCTFQQSKLSTCLSTTNETEECDVCIARSILIGSTSCTTLSDSVCAAIYKNCKCAPCQRLMEELLQCSLKEIFGCSINCCATVKGDLDVCLTNVLGANQTCDACVAKLIPASVTTCDLFQRQLCGGIANCGCGQCQGTIETFINCAFHDATGCSLTCPASTIPPSATTTAVPAPSGITMAPTGSGRQCNSSQQLLQSCFDKELTSVQQDACNQCVAAKIPNASLPCDAFRSQMCAAIQACPCGNCRPNVQVLLDCTFTASIQCRLQCDQQLPTSSLVPSALMAPSLQKPSVKNNSISPVATPLVLKCTDAQIALRACYLNLGTDKALNCDACVASAAIHALHIQGCNAFAANICPALYSCSCGNCVKEIVHVLDCSLELENCNLNCTKDRLPTILPPTVSPAASTNTSKVTCDNSRPVLQACFDRELGLHNASQCDQCVAKSIPQSFTNCHDFTTAICASIQDCPCGKCRTQIERYVNCSFANTTGCSLACNSSFLLPTLAPAITQTSAAFETTRTSILHLHVLLLPMLLLAMTL